MVVLLFAEHCDFAVPVHQHGKGGRLHPPYIQGAVVEDGEQPGGVDPDEPVGFLAAEGGLIQRVILGAGAQVSEALPDRRVLHRGDPQTGEGLPASRHLIDQPEDELALPPGVAGVDQLGDIHPVHKAFQVLEGVLLVLRQHIAEGLRQDGKVVILPLLIAGVVAASIGDTRCPTHQETMSPFPSKQPSALDVTPRADATAFATLGFSQITSFISYPPFLPPVQAHPR